MKIRWPWRAEASSPEAPPSQADRARLRKAERELTVRQAEARRQGNEARELGEYFRDQLDRNHLAERVREALGG